MADGDERTLGTGDEGGPDLLYEIARWRLDEQLERVKSLDNKLAATFTLNAAVIALFGVALAFTDRGLAYHVWGLAVGVLAIFVVNLVFVWRAYRQQQWSVRPDLEKLDSLIHAYSGIALREWAAREIMTSLTQNDIVLKRKGRDSRLAFAAAVVDAALIGITAVTATAPFA